MTNRRVLVAVALLVLAFGVAGTHIAANLGASAHAEHSSAQCHHEGCAPTPTSTPIEALCVIAAAVAVAAAAALVQRRVVARATAVMRSELMPLPAVRVRSRARQLSELCILRC